MIDRYCFVKLKDEHAANRTTLAEALHAMLDEVEGIDVVTVGVPADDAASSWDLSLVLRSRDRNGWAMSNVDEQLREVFDGWLPEKAEVVKAWTFEVD